MKKKYNLKKILKVKDIQNLEKKYRFYIRKILYRIT